MRAKNVAKGPASHSWTEETQAIHFLSVSLLSTKQYNTAPHSPPAMASIGLRTLTDPVRNPELMPSLAKGDRCALVLQEAKAPSAKQIAFAISAPHFPSVLSRRQ